MIKTNQHAVLLKELDVLNLSFKKSCKFECRDQRQQIIDVIKSNELEIDQSKDIATALDKLEDDVNPIVIELMSILTFLSFQINLVKWPRLFLDFKWIFVTTVATCVLSESVLSQAFYSSTLSV